MSRAVTAPSPVAATVATKRNAWDADLFENAPPRWVQTRLGLIKPAGENAGRRAVLVLTIGWAPLLVLAAASSAGDLRSLLADTGVHARSLLAAPLLVLAEAVCARRLNAIVGHFSDAGIVPEHERGRFDSNIQSTRALLRSRAAEAGVVVLVYGLVVALVASHPVEQIPVWRLSGTGLAGFSLAGWWHHAISLPLLLVLIFGWLWRLALWARFLWLTARLDLRLVASHPDHAAGLAFLGQSLRAFALVGAALAIIAAGRSAEFVLRGGELPTPYLIFNAGLIAVFLALFVAPLLVFMPALTETWRRGALEYGALAERVGGAFEQKWLGRNGKIDDGALERPDFSATTDLYAVASNVYALRLIPLDVKDLIALAVAMLLPFVPVVLLAVPMDLIVKGIKGLLF